LHGIVHAAMYDAVIAIEGGFDPYAISPEVDRPASPAAAVAAAHDVLVARVPAQAPYVDARYEEYLNAIPDRPAKTNGIAVGRAVAAGIIALRADDGFDNDVPYVQPAPGPGVFEPTPPPAVPVDVKLAHVRPLTFDSPSRFRPRRPTACRPGKTGRTTCVTFSTRWDRRALVCWRHSMAARMRSPSRPRIPTGCRPDPGQHRGEVLGGPDLP
jgi:hypothetical protein